MSYFKNLLHGLASRVSHYFQNKPTHCYVCGSPVTVIYDFDGNGNLWASYTCKQCGHGERWLVSRWQEAIGGW